MEQKQQKKTHKFTFYYETEEERARLEAFQRETGFSYEPFSPPVREDVSESVAAALPAVIPETPLKSAQPQPQPQPLQQMPVFPSTDVAAAAAPEALPVTIVGGGRFVRISFSSKEVLAATTEPRPNVSVLCVDVFKKETENKELGMVDASFLSAGERRMHYASFAVSEAGGGLLPRTQPPRGAKKGISADQRGPPDSAPQFTEPFSRDLPDEAVWKNAKTVALIYKTVLAFLELDDVKTNLRDPINCPHVIIRCKSGVNRSRVIASILRLLLANGVFHADVRKALQTSVLHDLSDDQRLVWDEPFVFAVVSAVNGLKLGQLRETLTRDYVTKETLTRDFVTKESHSTLQESHSTLQENHTTLQESHTTLQESHSTLQENHTTLQKSFEQFQRYLEKRLNGQTTLSFKEFQAQEAVSAAAAAAAAPSAEGETAEPEAKRQKH